ncbi:MAG TPA: class I adenylate-forming enzyme family protein [Polyangiales bacterium]|nr:class I adenylate-forming enzyme family protein [Polyangiales bacterium]
MAADLDELLRQDFGSIPELIRYHARIRPTHLAVAHDQRRLSYAELDAEMDRVAASLQRDGLGVGAAIAVAATTSVEYAVVFLGAVRAGVAVAPLAPSSTAESLAAMIADCQARRLFLDAGVAASLGSTELGVPRVALDGSNAGQAWQSWLMPPGARPAPVTIAPDGPFNIIYSSGTTGVPKGIVQPNKMRWAHVRRGGDTGYNADSVTLISTPLYSNTTLVSFFPALTLGGSLVMMSKFDASKFLALAEQYRVTHAMLVPVQYQRIMDHPEFDRFDLSSFRAKYCTSAPFSAALKARILQRWPGALIEFYGMTEGGGTCVLQCHAFPDKLHTVGKPAPGHDIRLIDDNGREVGPGEAGEVVGRSPVAMMSGYHNQPQKTADAIWVAPDGTRFIRTGDVGRFDPDGFLLLLDRKKDMIISGGFNIYPSDLEAVLTQHPAVADAAVVGVASDRWGETPIAFVVRKPATMEGAEQILAWVNERVGKTQRLTDLQLVSELPRSPIGKVLKRQLRDEYAAR